MERDDDCEGQFLRNLLTDFETDESTHFIIAIFFPVQNDNDSDGECAGICQCKQHLCV